MSGFDIDLKASENITRGEEHEFTIKIDGFDFSEEKSGAIAGIALFIGREVESGITEGEVKNKSPKDTDSAFVTQKGTQELSVSFAFSAFPAGPVTVNIPVFVEEFENEFRAEISADRFPSKDDDLKAQSVQGTTFDFVVSVPDKQVRETTRSVFNEQEDDSPNDLKSVYSDRVPFKITNIDINTQAARLGTGLAEIVEAENGITFGEFDNPTVAIDGGGRFVKHNVIGGPVVRQKIGEEPLQVSVNGVCDKRTANKIDFLRNVNSATFISSRLPGSASENNVAEGGGSLRVQIGSTSTEPITDGGAADLETGEYLYSYSINAIEVK